MENDDPLCENNKSCITGGRFFCYNKCSVPVLHFSLIITEAVRCKDVNFGNARYVRNLFEKIITQQANRISSEQNVTNEMLAMIEEIDVINANL